MRRLFTYLFRFLLIFIVFGCGILYLFLFTQPGLQWSISLAKKFAPGHLEIAESSGVLSSHFILKKIHFVNDDLQLDIKQFELRWRPFPLLSHRLFIHDLFSEGIEIHLLQNKNQKNSGKNQTWIRQFWLDNLNVSDINLYRENSLTSHIWNIQWKIQVPNLHSLYTDLAGSVISTGTISTKNNIGFVAGDFHVKQVKFENFSVAAIDGTISSAAEKNALIRLDLIGDRIKLADYDIPQIRIFSHAKLLPDMISTESSILFSSANQIHMSVQLPNALQEEWKDFLRGAVTLNFNDISEIISSVHLKSLKGRVMGNIKLAGSLSHPAFQGSLDINNGQFFIPALGIHPRAVNFHNTFTQALLISVNGRFNSGAGHGVLKGTVDLSQANFPLRLTLQGNQLQVANTDEYKITASPNLNITLQGKNASITGNLLLPYVHITLEEYTQIVNLPKELVFAGEKKSAPYFNNFSLQLQLELGKKVHLEYQQLNADLGGKIFVSQVPGGFPLGNGALHIIRGTYQIYDKLFTIEDGRLIYVKNLITNPGLDIDAFQELHPDAKNFMGFGIEPINHYVHVGVSVRGTLIEPVVKLISEPPLSQEDILSYMIFGQPRSEISAHGALTVLSTLATSMDSSDPTLGDQSGSTHGLSSVAKLGVFNPAQALNLNLPISRKWKIRTETTTTETGVDLLYEYETH